jgi:uncharacterized membrane protein YhaH (DUF805 family)
MIEVIKKYGNFNRSATRSEYWGVLLSVFALYFLVMLVSIGIMVALDTLGLILGLPLLFVGIFVFTWINIATIIARCRDAGINPWFTAACFIPYIGTIVAVVIGCLKSKE